MRWPRASLAALGFVVLVIALDLGVVRFTFARENNVAAGCLFMLMPVIDVLLIALYRLRHRERRTPRAVGFLAAGSAATALVIASALLAPETTTGLLAAAYAPIALAIDNRLTRHLGNPATWHPAPQWAFEIGVKLLLPMSLFSLPPLLAALLGAGVTRRLRAVRATADVPPSPPLGGSVD